MAAITPAVITVVGSAFDKSSLLLDTEIKLDTKAADFLPKISLKRFFTDSLDTIVLSDGV